ELGVGVRPRIGGIPGGVPRGLRDDSLFQGAGVVGWRGERRRRAGGNRAGGSRARVDLHRDQSLGNARSDAAVLRGDGCAPLLHVLRVRGERNRGAAGRWLHRYDGHRVGAAAAVPRHLPHGAVAGPAGIAAGPRGGGAGVVRRQTRTGGAAAGVTAPARHRCSKYTPVRMRRTLVAWASVKGPRMRSSLARTISISSRSSPARIRYTPK